MAATKRNVSKKEEVNDTSDATETTTPTQEKEVKPSASCSGCCQGCQCFKNILVFIITFLAVVGGFAFYLKQYQPDLYSKNIEIFFKSSPEAPTPASAPASTPVTEAKTDSETDKKFSLRNINLDDFDDYINLEEKAYLKSVIENEETLEKIKDRPDLLKVREYMEEPIGQLVKRFSLEQQVVLFINSNDERSKITRLAISQAKIPYGIMEVDNEPRRAEIRQALFRMTAQNTFPFIFVNGKFYGNSFYLQKTMQDHSFYDLVDSEENKKNWLLEKEEYAQKIEKRKKEKEEREQKKLEKILKKMEKKFEDDKQKAEL